jgi:hypothetical protein
MSTGQSLRFLDIAGVVEQVELEQLLGFLNHFFGPIEALWVHLEDSGRIDCKRTVDINGNRRNCTFARQAMERVDHFLCSSDGEGWD